MSVYPIRFFRWKRTLGNSEGMSIIIEAKPQRSTEPRIIHRITKRGSVERTEPRRKWKEAEEGEVHKNNDKRKKKLRQTGRNERSSCERGLCSRVEVVDGHVCFPTSPNKIPKKKESRKHVLCHTSYV